MDDYGSATYGDRIAAIYDSEVETPADTDETVAFLAGLAGPGPVLELGIGTGRIALPLLERGLEVHGIDASERMVERLRAKPGGDRVAVTIGDFAEVAVDGTFPLVFVVFNTFLARLAGLGLAERWSGWRREPFTSTSQRHVSIYRHP